MAQAVVLPSRSFRSKTEAIDHFKQMLYRYNHNQDLSTEDSAILFELLQRHPDPKIGVGVKGFYRGISPIHRTSCFHFERTDGSTTDFSYRKCIDGYETSVGQRFAQACRYAVSAELIRQKTKLFRDAGGKVRCSRTGVLVSIEEADYCHTKPEFKNILDVFVLEHGINITPALITASSDMQYVCTLADPGIEKAFIEYHADKACFAVFKKYTR